jgi:hypothetical protein
LLWFETQATHRKQDLVWWWKVYKEKLLEAKSQAIFLVLDKCKQKATLNKRILRTQRTYLLTQLNLKEKRSSFDHTTKIYFPSTRQM